MTLKNDVKDNWRDLVQEDGELTQGHEMLLRNASGNAVRAKVQDVGLAMHSNISGWADYADTEYTSGSPFSLSANTDTVLPNNGASGVKSYEPVDYPLYDTENSVITGREGDSKIITINCQVTPTNAGTTYIEFWFDIGGSVGELYRRIVSFPKGNGVLRPITLSTSVYTLDTWEANGATVYCRANGTAEIYSIRYIIQQLYTA